MDRCRQQQKPFGLRCTGLKIIIMSGQNNDWFPGPLSSQLLWMSLICLNNKYICMYWHVISRSIARSKTVVLPMNWTYQSCSKQSKWYLNFQTHDMLWSVLYTQYQCIQNFYLPELENLTFFLNRQYHTEFRGKLCPNPPSRLFYLLRANRQWDILSPDIVSADDMINGFRASADTIST